MVAAEKTIFISHVNGDPDAELVLQALLDDAHGLKQGLKPTHDAYDVVYDREIIAGKEWQSTLYAWLVDCAAAIVIVSKLAFDPDKPWVSHEATVLTITQTWRRDLCIIPVLLEGTESLLTTRPTFKPGRLPAIQALRFPDLPHVTTPNALVVAIAKRLKQELAPHDKRPLTGLTALLYDKLSEFPQLARRAAASVLDPAISNSDAASLAKQFLAADDVKVQQAFYALCDKSREARFSDKKQEIAHILAAQLVRAADAKPIAVEAAIPSASGRGRALFFDSEDPDILDLYLARATQRYPHSWDVKRHAPEVLEYGYLDDLKKSVRKLVTDQAVCTEGLPESMQLLRGNAIVGTKRRSGFPVLLRLDYPTDRAPASAFHAVREVCPELLLLFTASPKRPLEPPVDPVVCQIPSLGVDGYEQVIGPYGALIYHCRATTPEEEPQP